MIISRAPVRISFFGGGTDYPEYFREHGGAVLATAIDKFSYVTASPFLSHLFDYSIRIVGRTSLLHNDFFPTPADPEEIHPRLQARQ